MGSWCSVGDALVLRPGGNDPTEGGGRDSASVGARCPGTDGSLVMDLVFLWWPLGPSGGAGLLTSVGFPSVHH